MDFCSFPLVYSLVMHHHPRDRAASLPILLFIDAETARDQHLVFADPLLLQPCLLLRRVCRDARVLSLRALIRLPSGPLGIGPRRVDVVHAVAIKARLASLLPGEQYLEEADRYIQQCCDFIRALDAETRVLA
jgi:hypothetical protein